MASTVVVFIPLILANAILLEAGGRDRTRLVRKPGMIAIFHNVPALKKRLDWGYYTVPQAAARGRRIPQPRGWVLGGSGSINGMLFVRGNQKNYDDWAAAGCKGWSFADVLPSFRRMEDWEGGASALRGAGGPIKVTRQQDLTPASEHLSFLSDFGVSIGVVLAASDGAAIEMRDGDDEDLERAAANLGINLSRNESASVEDLA